MGSTDTGDFFPDDYNREDEVAFTEGWGGSQAMLTGGSKGPQLPGMENLGADAIVQGGVTVSSEIPPGMQFIPSSVPDGVVEFTVGSTSGTHDKGPISDFAGSSVTIGKIFTLISSNSLFPLNSLP
jgi:hypothetical protein